ncbi:MAG: rhomboid family intramembrane serine protease [Halobacteriales archaeon]|nr:rhomboid family intramembrane serine protease [Halobacteriales archaeon]
MLVPGLLLSIEWAIQSNFGVLAKIERDPMWFELSRESYLSFDTIFDLYVSSFAHSDWNHLQGNLVNYLFCISALYPMSILANKRKNNLYLILVIFLLSPIVVKLVSNVYLTGRTIGYSGILSGLFGLLNVVIFVAVDEQIEADFNPFWSLITVFLVYIAMLVYFGAFVPAGYTRSSCYFSVCLVCLQ